jgi:hypothetical protein
VSAQERSSPLRPEAAHQPEKARVRPGLGRQDFTAWFTEYPSTHRLAGQTVEVVPRSLLAAEREARQGMADALKEAADDLGKAANQFASMRETQRAGHLVHIIENPEIFEAKEAKARAALAAIPERREGLPHMKHPSEEAIEAGCDCQECAD